VKNSTLALLATLTFASAPAFAEPLAPVLSQDVDDELDDILGPADPNDEEQTVREERRDLEDEADRDAATQGVELPPAKKKVIKTLQEKGWTKVGRVEMSPFVGIVTNDPFVRRITFGTNLAYHITEIFAFEVQAGYSPDFGEGDHKSITSQILEQNGVTPEISRLMWHTTANFNFSPFYGKMATLGRNTILFDLYGTFGGGVAGTRDDIELSQGEDDAKKQSTAVQAHPTITIGGGLRVSFNKTVGIRLEARSLSYINTIAATTLELKNNFSIQLGASFFFGRGKQ